MHPVHENLDSNFISDHCENFLKTRIPRANATNRVVLPPPELGSIESELKAIFAYLQLIFAHLEVVFRRLSPRGGPSKLRHQRVDFGYRGSGQRHWATLSQSNCSASCVADRPRDSPPHPKGLRSYQRNRQKGHAPKGSPLRPNRSLEQGLGRPHSGFPAG